MKLVNKTDSTQQINLIGGSVNVEPRGNIEIAESEIYDFEKKRIMNFFKIEGTDKPASRDNPKKRSVKSDKEEILKSKVDEMEEKE